jgi:hypothetical protein
MDKVVTAVYDATQNMLRLAEPLDGVRDHEMVRVRVTASREDAGKTESPSMALNGILSEEAGEELSQAINTLFPPWTNDRAVAVAGRFDSRQPSPKTIDDGCFCSLDGFICSVNGFRRWTAANFPQDEVIFRSSDGIFC